MSLRFKKKCGWQDLQVPFRAAARGGRTFGSRGTNFTMQVRQLNPHQTARFVHNMRRLNPHDQADIALKWRERAVNVVNAFNPGAVGTGLQVATSTAYAGILGWWDGDNEAERAALVEEWKTTTAPKLNVDTGQHDTPFRDVTDANGQIVHKAIPDPRNWLHLNKTLWPTLGLMLVTGGAALMGEGVRIAPYTTALAIGGIGYLAGTTVRDAAYKAKRDKLRATPLPQIAPTSNPWRRHRAA